MDIRLLVFRALGVPDAIENETNRMRAAARKLAERGSGQPLLLDMRDDREDLLREFLEHVVARASAGDLDGLLGGYKSLDSTVTAVTKNAPSDGYYYTVNFAAPLLEAIVAFVETHPFEDGSGRYFA